MVMVVESNVVQSVKSAGKHTCWDGDIVTAMQSCQRIRKGLRIDSEVNTPDLPPKLGGFFRPNDENERNGRDVLMQFNSPAA
jgi:hypothetical protein